MKIYCLNKIPTNSYSLTALCLYILHKIYICFLNKFYNKNDIIYTIIFLLHNSVQNIFKKSKKNLRDSIPNLEKCSTFNKKTPKYAFLIMNQVMF